MTTATKNVTVKYIPQDEKADYAFGNIPCAYGATQRYVTYGGKPIMIAAGEFHFSRYDCGLWETEIAKMKAQGLNCISTYVFWNHHEKKAGKFDFSGNNDINRFAGICRKYGLKLILRIGPWCHGEVKRGGFPDYTALIPGKRRNTPLYLYFVKRFWTALAEQVKEFCDGETVLGIQLENEYNGRISHIVRLRKIAEEAGFMTPFFTVTAWPTDTPDGRFLPMFGGYPEAPWAQHKRPLEPEGRFAITEGRSEVAIGEDLLGKKRSGADFSAFPYATCEVGVGNQVTQHRRPVISENDGYGVAFAKLASGAVWLGYYMYHGGRNPSDRPMQESRRTFYPNDYPIVDYDFQAPLSKDGDVRQHADKLRLMHYFIAQNEESFARTQAFFCKNGNMPYFSYRADERGGYVFLSNYERGEQMRDENVDINLSADDYAVKIEGLVVPADAMWFFPIRQRYGKVMFDYITAQPILKTEDDGKETVFFVKYGDEVRISAGGKEITFSSETYEAEGVKLRFMPYEKARKLYFIRGKVLFSEFPLYEKDGMIFAEEKEKADKGLVLLKKTGRVCLPFNAYMFTSGRREYYKLSFDNSVLSDGDAELTLGFKGLNLQIFKGKQIVDDCFNTDGRCVFRLAQMADNAERETELTVRVAAATKRGRGRVYNETKISPDMTELSVLGIKKIRVREIEL